MNAHVSVPRSGVTGEPGVGCDWCGEPVLDDESFCVMRAGSVSHTNNAEPSCLEAYQRWLREQNQRFGGKEQ